MNENTSSDDLNELRNDQRAREENLAEPGTRVQMVKAETLRQLQEDQRKLRALEAAGVDNWEGYDTAMEIMREMENEEG